jgi:hypothetical protein
MGQTLTDFDNQGNQDIQTLSNYINGQFTKSMGFYSTLGWNSTPGVFDFLGGPHFEFGIGAGVDLIQVTSLNNANLQVLQSSANVSIPSMVPAPLFAGTLRLGLANGLDIGLKGLYLPASLVNTFNTGITGQYSGVGVDFRYRIMEARTLPTLTVEVSWDQFNGNLGFSTEAGQITTFNDPPSNSVTVSGTTNYALNWNVHSFGAKVLLGKDLLVVYPYVGVGFQRNSGSVDSQISGQLATSDGSGNTGSINLPVTSNGSPVVFEPKFIAGLDFGEGFHWSILGESNGSDIAVSTGFRGVF